MLSLMFPMVVLNHLQPVTAPRARAWLPCLLREAAPTQTFEDEASASFGFSFLFTMKPDKSLPLARRIV